MMKVFLSNEEIEAIKAKAAMHREYARGVLRLAQNRGREQTGLHVYVDDILDVEGGAEFTLRRLGERRGLR